MTGKVLIFIVIIVFIGTLACNEDNNHSKNNPPPPPPDNRCSTLKANTYQSLKNEDIEVLFNDTFKEAIKGYYLDSIVEEKYGLNHVRVFNSDFSSCVQPIIDSALAAKYGASAKDSIINEAYKLTEIIYKQRNKAGH